MKSSLVAFILVFLWSMTMAKKETQYTNMWIAKIHGGEEVAQRVARDLGYTYKSPAEPFEDHYIFIRDDHPVVSKRNSQHLTRNLLDVDEVKWAEQQAIVERSKRGYLPIREDEDIHEWQADDKTEMFQDIAGSSNVMYLRGLGDDGSETSSNTVYVSVGSSDTFETILSNVMNQIGSNKVGALMICNNAITANIANKLNYQLARSGKVSGGLSIGRISGSSITNSYIDRMVNQLQAAGQVGPGTVAIAFTKGSSTSASVPSQGANPANDNVATSGGQSDESIIVTASVGRGDSASKILNSVLKALGNDKKLGLLVVTGNILDSAGANALLNNLASMGKLGGGGVAMLSMSSTGGTAGKRALNSMVTQYATMGVVGGENVAVIVREGMSSSSDSGNQGVSAVNSGSGTSQSSNLGALVSGSETSNANTKPSSSTEAEQTSQPSSGNKVDDGSNSESNTQAATTSSSTTNDKVLVVNIKKVTSLGDYVVEQLGNSLVCAIILSGKGVDQNLLNDLFGTLSLHDKVGGDGDIAIMQISQQDGSPVNARGLFGSVSDLVSKGKVGANDKILVLTTDDTLDMAAFNEMMEEGDQGDLSKLGTFPTQPTDGKAMISTYQGPTKHIGCLSSKESAYKAKFNDPLWPKQWYAQDYRTTNVPVMDHNLVPVYDMGYTGEGIYVAVVDDGVVHHHPDLAGNFVESLSYDMCDDKAGSQPAPADSHGDNSHGTKCAGEIAMVANNQICGVGVAYNAKVGGIRTLGTQTIEYGEAKGLIYKMDTFDIYSNSWGPTDDGMTLQKVGHMTDESFNIAIKKGRGGKGTIYVFSAGNGKKDGDNCALDGLINHLVTIPIASVSQRGKTVYYSERCTAVFAGTYSGGNQNDEAVATTNINNDCTTTFSGTSAAAPLGTGIIALVLQANKDLTYRDVMHLITMSAEVAPLANNEGIWYKNGRGFWVSNDFGFGLMNAENMVRLAKTWKKVPPRNTCIVAVKLNSPQAFTVGDNAVVNFDTDACQDKSKDQVYYLEQIELSSTIQYPFRGAISMKITSPAGTVSDILETRLKDADTDGLNEWSIKSVHNWGENPKGKWKIEVKANAVAQLSSATGYVDGFTLLLHGTVEKPAHYNKPRKYAGFRLPNGKTSEV